MRPRFFVPDLDPSEPLVALPADEAAHLGRVLRLRAGADVRVFDGRGHEWHATVADVHRDRASVRILESVSPAPESRVGIALVVAVLKGEKMDDVVRDAVMLGVHDIQPIVSSRTEVSMAAVERSGRTARWQRVAVSSAKQCGRAVVPTVHPVRPLDAWLQHLDPADLHLLLVEPSAGITVMRLRDLDRPSRASLVVGPEGGWDSAEIGAATNAGLVPITLGARTLRADAVPLVALAVAQALWD